MNELDSVRGKGKSLCSFFSLLFQTSSVILLQPGMKSEAEILFFLVMFVCLKAQCHLILKCYGLTGFKVSLYSLSTLAASILRPEPSLPALNGKGLGGFV